MAEDVTLGDLSVDLRLRFDKLDGDMRKAQEAFASVQSKLNQSLSNIGAGNEKISKLAESFGGLGGIIGTTTGLMSAFGVALPALSVAGFASQMVGATRAIAEFGDRAEQLGVSVETFQALKRVARENSVEFETLEHGIQRFSRTVAMAAGGQGQAADKFRAAGVSLRDANGNVKEGFEVLGDYAEMLKRASTASERQALQNEIMGRGMSKLIPVLSGGRDAWNAYVRASEMQGVAFTGTNVEDAKEFIKIVDNAAAAWTSYVNKLVVGMALLPKALQVWQNGGTNFGEDKGLVATTDTGEYSRLSGKNAANIFDQRLAETKNKLASVNSELGKARSELVSAQSATLTGGDLSDIQMYQSNIKAAEDKLASLTEQKARLEQQQSSLETLGSNAPGTGERVIAAAREDLVEVSKKLAAAERDLAQAKKESGYSGIGDETGAMATATEARVRAAQKQYDDLVARKNALETRINNAVTAPAEDTSLSQFKTPDLTVKNAPAYDAAVKATVRQTEALREQIKIVGEDVGAQAGLAARLQMTIPLMEAFNNDLSSPAAKAAVGRIAALSKEIENLTREMAVGKMQADLLFQGSLIGATDEEAKILSQLHPLFTNLATDLQDADSRATQLYNTLKNLDQIKAGEDAIKSLGQGLLSDIRAGKSLKDILSGMAFKLGDKIFENQFNDLVGKLGKTEGGAGLFGALGKLLAPAGSAADAGKALSETSAMVIKAGIVYVNGTVSGAGGVSGVPSLGGVPSSVSGMPTTPGGFPEGGASAIPFLNSDGTPKMTNLHLLPKGGFNTMPGTPTGFPGGWGSLADVTPAATKLVDSTGTPPSSLMDIPPLARSGFPSITSPSTTAMDIPPLGRSGFSMPSIASPSTVPMDMPPLGRAGFPSSLDNTSSLAGLPSGSQLFPSGYPSTIPDMMPALSRVSLPNMSLPSGLSSALGGVPISMSNIPGMVGGGGSSGGAGASGLIGGGMLTGGAHLPSNITPAELSALNSVAASHNISPAAVSEVFKMESDWTGTASNKYGYSGLFQVGTRNQAFRDGRFEGSDANLLGYSSQQDVLNAPRLQQINDYGKWLDLHNFNGRNAAAGLDISKLPLDQQYAALQANQFAPNGSDWRTAAVQGNLYGGATPAAKLQAGALGDTSLGAMTRYGANQFRQDPPQFNTAQNNNAFGNTPNVSKSIDDLTKSFDGASSATDAATASTQGFTGGLGDAQSGLGSLSKALESIGSGAGGGGFGGGGGGLSGLFGGGGSSGWDTSFNIGDWSGFGFKAGGMVGMNNGPRVRAPMASFIGAPRFKSGGLVDPDAVPIIAHRREEVLPESHPRHKNNYKNHESMMGGHTSITIQAPDPETFSRSRGQIARDITFAQKMAQRHV